MYYFAIFQSQCGVFCCRTLTNHCQHTSHCRTAEVILPVQLNQSRQNDRQLQLYGVDGTDFRFQIHVVDGCFIGICFHTDCTKHPAIDIKMGIINGICLFRCHLVVSCGCGINRIGTAHSRDSNFTGAYAICRTHGTHAGKAASVGRISQFCAIERRTQQWTIRHNHTLLFISFFHI